MATKEIKATQEIDLLDGETGIIVNATATVYGVSKQLPRGASFGVELQFSSPGDVDVIVNVEQGNARPGTEEAADTDLYAVPANTAGTSVGLVQTVTDEVVHLINFSPVVSGYIRLKLTGQGTNNAATTLIKAKLVYVKAQ